MTRPGKEIDLHAVAERIRAQTVRLAEDAREIDRLEKQLRLVRGTRDLKARSTTEYHVGDDGPTSELYDVVLRMLQERPMTLQALIDETGARANRLKGVVWRLQMNEKRVVNLGTDTKAIWFICSEEVATRLARVLKKK